MDKNKAQFDFLCNKSLMSAYDDNTIDMDGKDISFSRIKSN